ncbi:MAG: ComF family protein [Candidatus Paceibacterota bacterium]|jgi:ComF family protein
MNYFKVILDLIFPEHCLSCKNNGTILCENCLLKISQSRETPNNYIISVFDYKDPIIKKVIKMFKYKNKRGLANILAKPLNDKLLEEISDLGIFENFKNPILIPIPLSRKRLKERGYNQSELLAKELVLLNKDFKMQTDILFKTRETKSQASIKNRNERLNNLKDCFSIKNKELIKNKNIILIDDIVTTGSTIKEARNILKSNGARKIIALTVAH